MLTPSGKGSSEVKGIKDAGDSVERRGGKHIRAERVKVTRNREMKEHTGFRNL